MRRRFVVRLAATLMLAGWDRVSVLRRKLPPDWLRFGMAGAQCLRGSVLQRRFPGASWSARSRGRPDGCWRQWGI